jgi:CBS domain-containing protein
MKVEKILGKRGPVYSIHPDNNVCEAAALMIEKRIGALIVLDKNGNIKGIITERDVLRRCAIKQDDMQCAFIKEIMTPKEKLITATKDQDLRSLMNCMTEKNIRHLPIVEDDKVLDVISIRDVVKILLEQAEFENKQIIDYMDTTRIEIDRIYG